MGKIAYLDCFSGISGDMMLGALLDLGLSPDELHKELAMLDMPLSELKVSKRVRGGIAGTHIEVKAAETGVVRYWKSMEQILEETPLEQSYKEKSLKILRRIAEAEAKVHGKKVEQVHFHEIGVIDTLVDVVGTVVGLDKLGIETLYSSPLATGFGMIKTEHGTLPVPTPATLEILQDIPVYSGSIPSELVTPTGAALVKELVTEFGEMPPMTIGKIGYGAGQRELDQPNVLRIYVGELYKQEPAVKKMLMLETNIDDFNPETIPYLIERTIESGALDCWAYPVSMKKGRSGIELKALVEPAKKDLVTEVIFRESTTLGIRIQEIDRVALRREIIEIPLEGESIHVKIGYLDGEAVNYSPEYEDCRKMAQKLHMPLKDIYNLAQTAARLKLKKK